MKTYLLYTIILICFILGCKPKQVEPLPQNGLLWKITGNGLNEVSYLFGTCHLPGGMQVLDSIKNFDSLFNSTNQLICEYQYADFIKYSEQKKENNHNFYKPWPNPDSTYNNLLTTKQKLIFDSDINSSELFKKFEKAKLNIRPITFLNFIQSSKENKRNIDKVNKPILDNYLQGLAKKRNINIVSLDSGKEYQKIIDSTNSEFPQLSYRNEVDILMYFIENQHKMDSLKNNYRSKIMVTYLKQDLNFSKKQSEELNAHNNIFLSYLGNDKFMKFQKDMLIDERNNLWMHKIPNLIKEKSSFIAVGAAHLGGEKGLINQLREQNYMVTSITKSLQ